MMLCDLTYYEKKYVEYHEPSLNSTDSTDSVGSERKKKKPTAAEYILVFWVLSFFADEIVQVGHV